MRTLAPAALLAFGLLAPAACDVARLPPLPSDVVTSPDPGASDTTADGTIDGVDEEVGAPDAATPDATPDGTPGDAASPTDVTADADAAESDAQEADAAIEDTASPADATEDQGPDGAGAPDAGEDVVVNPDLVDFSCADPLWSPGACLAGTTTFTATAGGAHVAFPQPIVYTTHPPSSGPHRPHWATWGEYDFLPAQYWLHNLEHGGVALLYHPCSDAATVDALRQIAQSRPDDEAGAFRWVLTTYPGLPSAVAAVAWEQTYTAECVDAAELGAFIDAHYRKAPEDIASDGAYATGWLGK